MRRIILAVAVVAAMAVSYGLGRRHVQSHAGSEAGRRVLYYVDPMHPAYQSDKPGIAPDCGMQLEPVYAEAAGSGAPSSPLAQLPAGAVGIDGATQRLLGIRVAPVERSGASRIIRAVGRVAPEDTRVYRVNSGVDGFIRETYNDSVGVQVKKDQKLATYYAPDFLAVASGFLAATRARAGLHRQGRCAHRFISRCCVQARVQQSSGLYRSPAQSRDERCADQGDRRQRQASR